MTARMSLLWLAPVIVACSAHLQSAAPSDQSTASDVSRVPPDTVWFFLDGQRIRRTDVSLIDRAAIASVSHWVGPAARARYGPDARDIVEMVSNRTMSERGVTRLTSPPPLYLLDGREVPEALVRALDAKRIDRVDVLKGSAALPYGEKAHAGVILIASKEPTR